MGEDTNIDLARLSIEQKELARRLAEVEHTIKDLPIKVGLILEKQDNIQAGQSGLTATVQAHMKKDEAEHAVLRKDVSANKTILAVLTAVVIILSGVLGVKLGIGGLLGGN